MQVRHAGQIVVLPSASDLPWRLVQAASADLMIFGSLVWPSDVRLSTRRLELVQRAWMAHNGLPELDQMRRLVYTIQRYYGALEYDLRNHLRVSTADLWRERRWRELLNYIDHLPANTHMNRLLTQDEEYMEMVVRSQKGDTGPGRPSMADWSTTNSLLATLIDAVNRNTAVQQGIANPKGPKPRVEPTLRPETVAEKVQHRINKAKHEEMVGLLLPSKR